MWAWKGSGNTASQTTQLFHIKMVDPCVRYYLDQQGSQQDSLKVVRGKLVMVK